MSFSNIDNNDSGNYKSNYFKILTLNCVNKTENNDDQIDPWNVSCNNLSGPDYDKLIGTL